MPECGQSYIFGLHRPNQCPAQDRKEAVMAEDTTSQDAAQQTTEPQGEVDNTDWKAEARKWEARAKENKDAAEKLAAYEKAQAEKDEASKTDLQKATEKAEKAIKELEAMKAERQRADMVKETAKSEGVDEELLALMSGNDEETIKSNAKVLKDKMDKIPKYPNVNDTGGKKAASGLSKKEILEIKNPREQLRAAIENPHAFD